MRLQALDNDIATIQATISATRQQAVTQMDEQSLHRLQLKLAALERSKRKATERERLRVAAEAEAAVFARTMSADSSERDRLIREGFITPFDAVMRAARAVHLARPQLSSSPRSWQRITVAGY